MQQRQILTLEPSPVKSPLLKLSLLITHNSLAAHCNSAGPSRLLQPYETVQWKLPRNMSKRPFQKDSLRRVTKTEEVDLKIWRGFLFVRERDLERKYLPYRRTGGSPGRRVLSLAQRLAHSSASEFFLP